jgi:hypothetical protein
MKELSDANRLNYVLDRWTGEGTSNMTPKSNRATANNVFSLLLRCFLCKNSKRQLGYSLNSRYTEKQELQVKIVGVNNLYTFTKYKGFDPGASMGLYWWRN